MGVNTDSCSVYGTGRIHCESTLSVNYHRAINRAEKEPRIPRLSLDPPPAPPISLRVGGAPCDHVRHLATAAQVLFGTIKSSGSFWLDLKNNVFVICIFRLKTSRQLPLLLCPFWH